MILEKEQPLDILQPGAPSFEAPDGTQTSAMIKPVHNAMHEQLMKTLLVLYVFVHAVVHMCVLIDRRIWRIR